MVEGFAREREREREVDGSVGRIGGPAEEVRRALPRIFSALLYSLQQLRKTL
jgi:hypothetical protein